VEVACHAGQDCTQTCRRERRENATLERAFQIRIDSNLSVVFCQCENRFLGVSGLIIWNCAFSYFTHRYTNLTALRSQNANDKFGCRLGPYSVYFTHCN